MITDKTQAARKIFNCDKTSKPQRLLDIVFGVLKIDEAFVERFNEHKTASLFPIFFALTRWWDQGTKHLNMLFCPSEGPKFDLGFKKSCLYHKLSSTKNDWFGLAHETMLKVGLVLIRKAKSLNDCFLVIDDSNMEKPRSRCNELSNTRLYNHNTKTYSKGFYFLQLGLVAGKFFSPLAFRVTSSTKEKNVVKEQRCIDQRTKAGKRRKEATTPKTKLVLDMLQSFQDSAFAGLTVLCDSWFISPNFIKEVYSMGYYVMGLHKESKTKYLSEDGHEVTVKEESRKIKKALAQGLKLGEIAKSMFVYILQDDGTKIKCKLIFAKNWRHDNSAKKKPYVAIITTRIDLSDDEIRKTYRKRWKIEQGFRIQKSWFGLVSGNSSKLFETNIAMIALTQIRYALLVACQAILFPNESLNKVRKMLVNESIYQDVIADVAESSQNIASVCEESINKAITTSVDFFCKKIETIVPEPLDDIKDIKINLLDEVRKIFYAKFKFVYRALIKEMQQETPGKIMLRNLLIRQNVTLLPHLMKEMQGEYFLGG